MDKKAKTSISLNSISNAVLDAQNKDIRLYTGGHLNEDHLWKSPEESTHKTWESANKPHLLMRPAHVFNKENLNHRHITQMSDRLVEFSLSASLTLHKHRNYTTPASAPKKDVYVEELKLPDLLLASNSKKDQTIKSFRSEYFTPVKQQQQQPSLPRISMANLSKEMPQSDIEIAYKVIHDPLSGVTKKEKLKNLRKFEENVIQKNDLTNSNVLYDTKKVRYLEAKLYDDLQRLNLTSLGANFHRLQVYGNCFEEIIIDKNIFGDILAIIKKEYDDYLYYLLDKNSNNSGSELRFQADLVKTNTERRTNEIKRLDKENEEIENYIIEMHKKATEINNQIDFEREFTNQHENNLTTLLSESTLSITSNITKAPTITIGDRIDSTKDIIMKKIKKMTQLNETLNKDYVPNVVISNLTQSIKDTEVEIQKLVKQSEFLTKQIDESENELKDILMSFDTTEFAEENVDYLLKSLKILDVLQILPNNEKSHAIQNTQTTTTTTTVDNNNTNNKATNEFISESQKFYDDYFS